MRAPAFSVQRRDTKHDLQRWGSVAAVVTVFVAVGMTVHVVHAAAKPSSNPVDKFNQQIEERKKEIDRVKRRIEMYQGRIAETQKEAASLRGQIKLIENEIAKKELDIELTTKQIAKTNLEIQRTAREITLQEKQIASQRDHIARLLQLIQQNDQVGYFEIILSQRSFSDFFDYYQRLRDVQAQLQHSMVKLKGFRAELALQQETLQLKKIDEEKLKNELEDQQQDLSEQSVHQATLLKETERSEKKYAAYVEELRLEQQKINQDIVGIEKKIREELRRRKEEADRIAALGKPGFIWPTSGRYITAYFHDPEYPFRNIFEHPGLDVRAPQGSPVLASEAGYVAKTKDGGAKGLSYVMLVHNEGLSTVYMHISSIDVREGQFVTKGQVIARSGGTPGTRGAGPLTTGPHLHFEVRKNGIPVNPLNFLPTP